MVLAFCIAVGCAMSSPMFSLETGMDWQQALEDGRIMPVMAGEWEEYMVQWQEFLVEGDPYPKNIFMIPDLYVYGGADPDLSTGDVGSIPGDGLVMAWGDDNSPEGSLSSAWMYEYSADPDLSNCTITITVLAPQFSNVTGSQINAVSFGMRDVNGLIRSWHWAVGSAASSAPIKWGVPTTITINTAVPGTAAASPVATGYASHPMFDITQVLVFIVDENANWIGGPTNVPPPGTVIARPWNLWSNLSVTKHPSNPIVVGTNFDVHMDIPGAIANDFHVVGESSRVCPMATGVIRPYWCSMLTGLSLTLISISHLIPHKLHRTGTWSGQSGGVLRSGIAQKFILV